jgi:hypothetical protein
MVFGIMAKAKAVTAPARAKAMGHLMGINNMARRATFLCIFFVCWVVTVPAFASIQEEAVQLADRYRANFQGIKTVKYECQIAVKSGEKVAGNQPVSQERVIWDRGKGKLKKKKSVGAVVKSYVADAGTRKLEYCEGSSTVMTDTLDESAALGMTTPFPGWLWNPEWLLPKTAARVREDGAAIVITSGDSHPCREIWLNRVTAMVEKYQDTDSKGNVFHVIVCRDWVKTGIAWLPREIEEEIRAKKGTISRIITLDVGEINKVVPDGEYTLP